MYDKAWNKSVNIYGCSQNTPQILEIYLFIVFIVIRSMILKADCTIVNRKHDTKRHLINIVYANTINIKRYLM